MRRAGSDLLRCILSVRNDAVELAGCLGDVDVAELGVIVARDAGAADLIFCVAVGVRAEHHALQTAGPRFAVDEPCEVRDKGRHVSGHRHKSLAIPSSI